MASRTRKKKTKTYYRKTGGSSYSYYSFYDLTADDWKYQSRDIWTECKSRIEFLEDIRKKKKAPKGFTFIDERIGNVVVYSFPYSQITDINKIKEVAKKYGQVYMSKETYRELDVSIFKQPIIDGEFFFKSEWGFDAIMTMIYDPERCAKMLKRREEAKNGKLRTGDVPISLLKPALKCLERHCRNDDLGQILKVSGYKGKKKEHWLLEIIALHQATGVFKTQRQLNKDGTYRKLIEDLFEFVPSMRSRISKGDVFRKFANWVEGQYFSQIKTKNKDPVGRLGRVLDF